MNTRVATVLFKDSVAGTLTETIGGGSRFAYTPEWSAPIACCLPVERRTHDWQQGLHPFFQHLGPEGWLRERQARVAHIAEEDDFGLLLRYGADCIGAVGVTSAVPLDEVAQITESPANPGRTVSGVQRKLLVVKTGSTYRPADQNGFAPYIAKFNSTDIPTLVRNEFLSLRWITSVLGKDEVTKFESAQIDTVGETALVVTRFDRTTDGKKLRLEDFAQILCKPRGSNYGGKYDADHEDVASAIRKHSARPEIDLDRFFRRLVVFALMGNCDGHLKNFSLLETASGLRLSPLYDVVNTAIYPEYDRNLALRIGGAKTPLEAATRPLLEDFARSIGLSKRVIAIAFKDLERGVRHAANLLVPPQGEPPGGFVDSYGEIVRGACLRVFPA